MQHIMCICQYTLKVGALVPFPGVRPVRDRNTFMTLLRRIARSEGVAIICSLHQPHFARSYADRIIGLSRGRVMFAVPADQFDQAACAQLYATPETPSANAI